tara:strand:- start:3552 stop:4034 length:483 start_codon:yes stop_codon:yes gene_type:complete
MGSDIFTESAVAVNLLNFIDIITIKKKANRELIANIFYQEKIINEESLNIMVKSKSGFIEVFIDTISMTEGYESDEDNNQFMINTFCEHGGIVINDLPNWTLRQFDSCRESGYDIQTNVLYIMFESYNLFKTVMTDEGKKVAETLGLDHIQETTWTVHSY